MKANQSKPKIIAIVGPTASGKTSLSIKLAKHFGGEIISADSRQVYRGLNLGTGKVTKAEMEGIPHHLLDVTDPKTSYTVADYVRDGREAITNLVERDKLPIVVGGTFFYVDALVGRVTVPEVAPNESLRKTLKARSAEDLFQELETKDPERAASIDPHNKTRLVRALEIVEVIGRVPKPKPQELFDTLILGIKIDRETLSKHIHTRLFARLDAGMIDEVKSLYAHGVTYERMESLGLEYRYIAQYLKRELSYIEMVEVLEHKIRQYAKRQMTWLKRDSSIVWVDPNDLKTISSLITTFLKR